MAVVIDRTEQDAIIQAIEKLESVSHLISTKVHGVSSASEIRELTRQLYARLGEVIYSNHAIV